MNAQNGADRYPHSIRLVHRGNIYRVFRQTEWRLYGRPLRFLRRLIGMPEGRWIHSYSTPIKTGF